MVTLPPPPEPEDNFHEEHPEEAPDASDVSVPAPSRPAPSLNPALAEVFSQASQAAATDLASAERAASSAQRALEEAEADLISLRSNLDRLTRKKRETVEALAAVESLMVKRAVSSFMFQDTQSAVASLLTSDNALDASKRLLLVNVVIENDQDVIKAYDELRKSLGGELATVAEDLSAAELEVNRLATEATNASEVLASAKFRADLLNTPEGESGSGFLFPIAGPHTFINDWGFPRSGGRRHQGTDIFASIGTPLVAVERGVIYQIKSNSLGGLVLWIRGLSGTSYYYAHLSAYANVTEGQLVRPGQLVGYVGDSGNAKGGTPHLHFQVHPNGGSATNPYPLLRAVSDTQEAAAAAAAASLGVDLDGKKPAQG